MKEDLKEYRLQRAEGARPTDRSAAADLLQMGRHVGTEVPISYAIATSRSSFCVLAT